MESAVLACDCEAPTAAAPGAGGGGGAAGDVAMLRRSALAACLTCPLCGRLLRDAATITECLHTFCRKCISEEFISKEVCCCPICGIDLGCAPLEKLRVDRSLQYVRSKVFPFSKKQRVEGPEVTSPITSPTKMANQGTRTSSAPDGQASEAATAGASVSAEPSQAKEPGSVHTGMEDAFRAMETAMRLHNFEDAVRAMYTAMSTMHDVVFPSVEFIWARSQEKSQYIRHLWDRLAEETQLRQGLAEQLDAARREVAELAPLGRKAAAESERLRKERDDLLRAVEELRAERDSARHGRADAQERIGRLEVQLEEGKKVSFDLAAEVTRQSEEVRKLSEQVHGLDGRLAAEVVKSRGLEKELAGVKDLLSKESEEHDALRVAVGVVCDDLKMVPEQGPSSLAARTVQITERAREMERNALRFGVHQSLATVRSHHEKLEADLEEIEKMHMGAPLPQDLAGKLEDEVVLPRA